MLWAAGSGGSGEVTAKAGSAGSASTAEAGGGGRATSPGDDAGPPNASHDADVDAGPLDCQSTPFALFGEARAVCGNSCRLCPRDVVADRVVGYFMIVDGRCPCSPPQPFVVSDAGVSGPPPADCRPRGNYLTSAQAELSCAADPSACRICIQNGSTPENARAWSVVAPACACPEPEGDACGSHAGLSEAEAISACAGLPDCHVCVQQTNASGAPVLWVAHACGCPAPFPSAD